MKTKHYVILGITLFIAILALTNPAQEIHKEKVRIKLTEFYETEMAKEDNTATNQFSQAGKSMGMILAKSMINMVIDNAISSSNYILFSTTNVTWEGKTKIIGIGILGNVFLTSQIDDAIKK
ncbi:DUF4359 domain-containing protein [Flavobacterium sp. N1736]|uniref:DUF4359 domain-containing protein n=1 Tax=Flavobacterium sp. N1736 TaxID=2986823 RepID=UPI002224115F|nr:DUF4359 domain-containing protein [Flavobacterium sp. N1736]